MHLFGHLVFALLPFLLSSIFSLLCVTISHLLALLCCSHHPIHFIYRFFLFPPNSFSYNWSSCFLCSLKGTSSQPPSPLFLLLLPSFHIFTSPFLYLLSLRFPFPRSSSTFYLSCFFFHYSLLCFVLFSFALTKHLFHFFCSSILYILFFISFLFSFPLLSLHFYTSFSFHLHPAFLSLFFPHSSVVPVPRSLSISL